MRKTLIIAFVLIICLYICACTGNPQESTTPSYGTVTNDPAHTHNYGQWTVSKAVTCKEDGEEKRTCECGSFETQTIKAKGHTEVVDNAVAPTCTETGLTEGKHCSVCYTVTIKQESVKAKGHTEVVDKAVTPTCTKTGLTEGKHCSVCNTVTVKQETVKAKGHTEVVDKAVAATCTETGLTEGKHCSVCNTVIVEQKELPAAHNAPYGICTLCNKVTDEQAAINHYLDVDTSVARGKTCTTYYNNALYVQYYISYVSYDLSILNSADGKIMISIDFDIDGTVRKQGSYYSGTGFMTYVISLNNYTLKSGYTSVRYGSADVSAYIKLNSIDELSAYGNYPCFFVNVGDYYM